MVSMMMQHDDLFEIVHTSNRPQPSSSANIDAAGLLLQSLRRQLFAPMFGYLYHCIVSIYHECLFVSTIGAYFLPFFSIVKFFTLNRQMLIIHRLLFVIIFIA